MANVGPRDFTEQVAAQIRAALPDIPVYVSGPDVDDDEDDPEEFCSDCFAGMESSEHHEKCVAGRY